MGPRGGRGAGTRVLHLLHLSRLALCGAVLLARGAWGAPPDKGITPVRHTRVISRAGTLRTVAFWSQALGARKHAVVWLPPSYETARARRYPVAYYLHGAFGNETNWSRVGHLDHTLDSLTANGMAEMIVVMPDGDDGWYTTWNWLGDWAACRRTFSARDGDTVDSYCVPWPHYDDYVARDLVGFIDRTFRTRADRGHRGIAGLSMGGYGAVTLALAYPEVFGAAASHSGVLAPRQGLGGTWTRGGSPAFNLDSLRASYGARLWPILEPAFGKDSVAWNARDPVRMARRFPSSLAPPPLYVDCGTDDVVFGQNEAFVDAMRGTRIPVEYHRWPGSHDWDYWRRHAAESATWLALQLSKR